MRSSLCRVVAVCGCVTLTVTAPGCSLLVVRPPPSDPVAPEELNCTSSTVAPNVDVAGTVLGAGVAILGLISAASVSRQPCRSGEWCFDFSDMERGLDYGAAAAGAILGGVYLVSAVYGHKKTARCRELQAWKTGVAMDPSLPWPAPRLGTRDALAKCEVASDCEEGTICFDGFCRTK